MSQKNIYEIGLLINPDLSQQEAGATVERIKDILEKQGASVISEGEVVDIDLAYQIITKIASKNERFDKAFFSWVKFEVEPSAQAGIKKEVDKIKREVFRYLIVKTVADDEATNKYQKIEEEREEVDSSENEEMINNEDADIVDTTVSDDLTKIEGIGPKIMEALNLAGVYSFADLALKTKDELEEIIAGVAGNHNPETWAEQAKLASEGEWEKLEEWQKELNGGLEK